MHSQNCKNEAWQESICLILTKSHYMQELGKWVRSQIKQHSWLKIWEGNVNGEGTNGKPRTCLFQCWERLCLHLSLWKDANKAESIPWPMKIASFRGRFTFLWRYRRNDLKMTSSSYFKKASALYSQGNIYFLNGSEKNKKQGWIQYEKVKRLTHKGRGLRFLKE